MIRKALDSLQLSLKGGRKIFHPSFPLFCVPYSCLHVRCFLRRTVHCVASPCIFIPQKTLSGPHVIITTTQNTDTVLATAHTPPSPCFSLSHSFLHVLTPSVFHPLVSSLTSSQQSCGVFLFCFAYLCLCSCSCFLSFAVSLYAGLSGCVCVHELFSLIYRAITFVCFFGFFVCMSIFFLLSLSLSLSLFLFSHSYLPPLIPPFHPTY